MLPSIILAVSIQTDRETWQRRVWNLGMVFGGWMAQLEQCLIIRKLSFSRWLQFAIVRFWVNI